MDFELVVGDHFGQFVFDAIGIPGLSSYPRQSESRLVQTVLLHPVSRRLGKEEKASSENESPDDLVGEQTSQRMKERFRSHLGTVEHTCSAMGMRKAPVFFNSDVA